MRITVIPEQLRRVARVFREAQSGWGEIGRGLRAQQSALDWDIRRQQAIEGQIGQAIRLAQALAEGAAERASWLEAAAARFEAADREAYQPPARFFRRASVPPIPQILGVWATGPAVRGFPATRLISGIVTSLGGLGAFALSGTLLQPLGDLAERVWNWIHGHGWRANAELAVTSQSSIPKGELARVIQRGFEKMGSRPDSNQQGRVVQTLEVSATPSSSKTPLPDVNAAREQLKANPLMQSMWRQVEAPIRSVPGQRHPELYSAVIDQFDVEYSHSGRYRPSEQYPDTRCNIFAGDVMRAMGAPLPTKGDLYGTNDPMTANAGDIHNALERGWGGWRKIDVNNPDDLRLLQEHLESGKPAVASDPGHIAVIRPNGLPDQLTIQNFGELHIAQAGARNLNDVRLGDAGLGTVFHPHFFIHD